MLGRLVEDYQVKEWDSLWWEERRYLERTLDPDSRKILLLFVYYYINSYNKPNGLKFLLRVIRSHLCDLVEK